VTLKSQLSVGDRVVDTYRLRLLGADNIAKTTRAIRDAPEHALWIWGITDSPLLPGT
jgi:hypothetical protein